MPRLYLPLIKPSGTIHITGEKAKYLIRVLRSKIGDDIIVFDGKGSSYKAVIKSITMKDVLAEVIEAVQSDAESPFNIVLIQGLLKGEKMELIIQKTTELGVKEIIPAITTRSQVRDTNKLSRWKKVAEDASRQSGRTEVPHIHEPISFDNIFSDTSPYNSYFRRFKGLLFWEEGGIRLNKVKEKLGECLSLIVAIGPEGGFTEEEVKTAESNGFIITSIGNRILRAETAAISATTIVQFLMGDLG
jgi:16S rRNA (uracil1498-N3)-methyltransferase